MALSVLAACGSPSGPAAPEVFARWIEDADGGGRILVTARAAQAIAGAEALAPDGRIVAAAPLGPTVGRREYGVSLYGSSDTGVGLGLSLDTLARALRPPVRRQDASIALSDQAAAAYRREWRDWQVVVRFDGGPTVLRAAPDPGG